MTDHGDHGEHPQHGDHGAGHFRAYMVVAVALGVFTIASFVVNFLEHTGTITPVVGFWVILGVAVVKAILVAMYFMHLVTDWGLVYFLIVPVLILAALTGLALLPDMVLDWPEL
jgi:caa(3)-type oxidase subunit IV